MKRYLSIILIFAHTSILFADTLTFNNGVTIEGKLVKYDEDYLIFKVDEESMKDIPNEAIIYIKGVILDENQVVFNNKFVKNVTENNIIVANPAKERIKEKINRATKTILLGCVGYACLFFFALWGSGFWWCSAFRVLGKWNASGLNNLLLGEIQGLALLLILGVALGLLKLLKRGKNDWPKNILWRYRLFQYDEHRSHCKPSNPQGVDNPTRDSWWVEGN